MIQIAILDIDGVARYADLDEIRIALGLTNPTAEVEKEKEN